MLQANKVNVVREGKITVDDAINLVPGDII
jgi:hypothetical protein